jgi:hypothetical protein
MGTNKTVVNNRKFLQFYADKRDCYTNKLFSFEVDSIQSGFRLLLHFHCKQNRFRAIFIRYSYFERALVTDQFIRLNDYEHFFKEYDSSHFPSLNEAFNDFKMSLL